MKYYGMDISSLQCVVDENIKRKNINFVILRATYGLSGVDPRFFENAEKLNRFNIPIGVYHSLCADNIYDSSAEAKYCISKISKFNIEYPVCLDINDFCINNLEKNKVIKIIKTFLNTIRDMNFYPCLFLSYGQFKKIDVEKFDVDLWVRCFEKEPENIKRLSIWQYTNSGMVENWGNNINLDVSYKDYPKIIREEKMNIINGGFCTLENTNETNNMQKNMTNPQSVMQISGMPVEIYDIEENKEIKNPDLKPVVYTVKPGDTLWGISQMYLGTGQKYYEIQTLNHLTDDIIHPGQTLLIPQNPMSGWMLYNVVSGDTLWNLSRKYLGSWTKYNSIMSLNNLENETIYPGQILKIPIQGRNNIYIVKPGDNLWNISLKLLGDGNRYYEIISLNNLGTSPVTPGQQLKIPEF